MSCLCDEYMQLVYSTTTSSHSFPLMNVVEWKPQECHPELMETRGCMEKECPTWDAEVLQGDGFKGFFCLEKVT